MKILPYVEKRQAICKSCPENTEAHIGLGKCKECGCPLKAKTIVPFSTCPLHKWGEKSITDEVIDTPTVPAMFKVIVDNDAMTTDQDIMDIMESCALQAARYLHFINPVAIPAHEYDMMVTAGGTPRWVQELSVLLVFSLEPSPEGRTTENMYMDSKNKGFLFAKKIPAEWLNSYGWVIIQFELARARKNMTLSTVVDASLRDISMRHLGSVSPDDDDLNAANNEALHAAESS